jgi:hypothetical protein
VKGTKPPCLMLIVERLSHRLVAAASGSWNTADARSRRLHAGVRHRLCQRPHTDGASRLLVGRILRDIPVLPPHERRPPLLHGGGVHLLPGWNVLDKRPPHDLAQGY